MTDTPNTQAVLQAADGRWTYSIKHFCESMELRIKELENERDTALDDLEFRRGLFQLQEQQLNAVRAERDRLAVELKEEQDAIGLLCWDCNGTLKRVCIAETYEEPVLGSITIKDIPILRCKSCGSEAIGIEGSTVVEEYIEKEYKKKGLERKYRRI